VCVKAEYLKTADALLGSGRVRKQDRRQSQQAVRAKVLAPALEFRPAAHGFVLRDRVAEYRVWKARLDADGNY